MYRNGTVPLYKLRQTAVVEHVVLFLYCCVQATCILHAISHGSEYCPHKNINVPYIDGCSYIFEEGEQKFQQETTYAKPRHVKVPVTFLWGC